MGATGSPVPYCGAPPDPGAIWYRWNTATAAATARLSTIAAVRPMWFMRPKRIAKP